MSGSLSTNANNIKEVLIIQNDHEIDHARKIFGSRMMKMHIIAWTPYAVGGLQDRIIPYAVPAIYQQDLDHMLQLTDQFKMFKIWCDRLDGHVWRYMPELSQFLVRPFRSKLHALRIKCFLLFNEIDRLQDVINGIRPDKLYVFHYPGQPSCLLTSILDFSKNIESVLNCSVVKLHASEPYKFLVEEKDLVPDWFDRRNNFSRLVNALLRPNHRSSMSLLYGTWSGRRGRGDERRTVLVLDYAWDLRSIFSEWVKRGSCRFIFWKDIPISVNIDKDMPVDLIVKDVQKDEQCHTWTTHRGVDVLDALVGDIKHVLMEDIPIMRSTAKQFRRMQNLIKFDLVVATYSLTQWEIIFDQCQSMGVPVVQFCHGGGTMGPLDRYPAIPICLRESAGDNDGVLYHFVHTDELARYGEGLKREFPRFPGQNVAVGSCYFNELANLHLGQSQVGV